MLVCNISLRPPRAGITADIAEVLAATDATATGNVVFATLVDDPASVGDYVDAYPGEIMVEAASAIAVADGGLSFICAIDEPGSATSVQDASTVSIANTWNTSDAANITFSNGNLTATSTANPAGVRHTTGHNSGKYYWEVTLIAWGGTSTNTGLATATAALVGGGVAGQAVVTKLFGGINGTIYINGSYSSSALGALSNQVIGIAADLTAGLIWFRIAPSGNWNGSGTANPATGVGGISLGALAGATLFPFFGASSGSEDVTGNFGATAFTGAVPSGFTSGW